MKSEYLSKGEQETEKYGVVIAQSLHGGGIVTLSGELGAGKTTLIKGIASHFGIEDIVSPTFTLMQVYKIANWKLSPATRGIPNAVEIRNLVHIDTYRLKNERELIDIGVEDYLGDPETVCLIEWPEKISELLKNKKVMNVTLSYNVSVNERHITLKS